MFTEIFTYSLIAGFVTSIAAFLSGNSKNNHRLFYYGLLSFLIAGSVYVFDINRKRYAFEDYSAKQIIVKKCAFDEQNTYLITTSEDLTLKLPVFLLRLAGDETYLAKMICAEKSINVWLNDENEISGIISEKVTIPLEIGILSDNRKHDFRFLIPFFGVLGLILMGIALLSDWLGIKIDISTGKSHKARAKRINLH